jgi:hypothetical protein
MLFTGYFSVVRETQKSTKYILLCARNIACIQIWQQNMRERDNFEDLGIDERTILNGY